MPSTPPRAALEADYRHMQNKIFGPRPPFSEILETVRDLEREMGWTKFVCPSPSRS